MNQPPPRNDRGSEPRADAPSGSDAPLDSAELLGEIVGDVQRFLDCWTQRFDQLLQQCRDRTEQDAELHGRAAAFEQQRRQWEQQRQRETEQLHQKAEQLTEAWLRLEQQQREVLQAQASLKQRSTPAATVQRPPAQNASAANPSTPIPGAANPGAANPGAANPGAANPGAAELGAGPAREHSPSASAMQAGAMQAGAMQAGAMQAGAMQAGAMQTDRPDGSAAQAPPAHETTISSGLSHRAAVEQFERLKQELGHHRSASR